MRTLPPGSRFHPTELGLVKLHLKNKVEKNESGFIKTLDVYGDAPWRLEHDTNHLYPKNEWYYFVPRRIRGENTVSRIVPPRNGESLGGTWRSIIKKQKIKKNEVLVGYKNELVFNKNVDGKSTQEKTDWHMHEYSTLDAKGEEVLDLVLCHVRLLHSAVRFKPLVPPAHHQVVENNDVLQNQEQQEEAVGFANHNNDMMMMVETNQQQEQEQQGQFAYHVAEEQEGDMTTGYEYDGRMQIFNQGSHVNQQQEDSQALPLQTNVNQGNVVNQHQQQQYEQQQEDSQALPLQTNVNHEHYSLDFVYDAAFDDLGFDDLDEPIMQIPNDNQEQQEAVGFANQQQEQQDSLPPLESNDENQEHFPCEEDYAFDGADDNLTIGVDVLLKVLNEGKEEEDSSPTHLLPPLHSNDTQEEEHYPSSDVFDMTTCYGGLMEIFKQGNVANQHERQQQDSLIPLQKNNSIEQQCPFAYHGAVDDDMNTRYDGLMQIFKQGNHVNQQQQHEQQQQDPSQALPLQTNVNQEHYSLEDIAYDAAFADLGFDDLDEPIMQIPNDNQDQYPSVQNNNANTVVLPNQEQREADGFANQHPLFQSNNNQEEHYPSWDDFGFDVPDDDLIMQNMDEGMIDQRIQELFEDLAKPLSPVPDQAQDSGVHADQVMPKD